MMKISFIATIKHLSTGKQNFEIEFEEVWKTAEKTESNHFVGEKEREFELSEPMNEQTTGRVE